MSTTSNEKKSMSNVLQWKKNKQRGGELRDQNDQMCVNEGVCLCIFVSAVK